MAANPTIVASTLSKDDKSDNKKEFGAKAQQELAKNLKTETALYASDFLTKLGPDVVKKIGGYQNNVDLAKFCKTFRFSYDICKSDMGERQRVTKELLPHVFKANPQDIDEFMKKPNTHPRILLIKSSYREGYLSKELNKFICFRHWKGVSALQAAYLCGDGPFLGEKLLAYIIRDNKLPPQEIKHLLVEAVQQLQELLNRIDVKSGAKNALMTNTATNGAATMPSVATTAMTIASVSSAPEPNKSVNSNEKIEQSHSPAVNIENEFADSAEFLAPLKELIKAYKTYIAQYDSVTSQKKWTEINKLWGQVGECHKKLPQYVLQEFFGPTLFDPLPDFTEPPPRVECRDLDNNNLLDLDKIGMGTIYGLYKRVARRGRFGFRVGGMIGSWRGPDEAQLDMTAVSRLCELREIDLRNTFSRLQKLESAFTLINNDKTLRIAL